MQTVFWSKLASLNAHWRAFSIGNCVAEKSNDSFQYYSYDIIDVKRCRTNF